MPERPPFRVEARSCSLALLFALPLAVAAQCEEAPQHDADVEGPRRLAFENEPWSGDFDGMLERRAIRVLLPYSRTLYFNDRGQDRGVSAELVRDFETHLNRKHAGLLAKRPITVYIVPTRRDLLIPNVIAGLGDIAAGNLTETPERLKSVDFVAPKDRKPLTELVVRGPSSPAVASVDDLAGKRVHVRESSSYYESLKALDQRFKRLGKRRIEIVLVPEELEDEDLLEMSNAGLVELTVVDAGKARAWAQVLPEIIVTDVVVAEGGHAGWAIRKDSPRLAEAIEDFYVEWAKKSGVIEYRNAQYLKRIQQISNNTATDPWKRFEQLPRPD